MERDQIVPAGVLVEAGGAAVDRPAAVGAFPEDACEAAGQVLGHLHQVGTSPGARRVLDHERGPAEGVELLERADDQVVHGEPHRATPVGVAAEEARAGFGRLIVHAIHVAVDVNLVRVFVVIAGKRTNPEV